MTVNFTLLEAMDFQLTISRHTKNEENSMKVFASSFKILKIFGLIPFSFDDTSKFNPIIKLTKFDKFMLFIFLVQHSLALYKVFNTSYLYGKNYSSILGGGWVLHMLCGIFCAIYYHIYYTFNLKKVAKFFMDLDHFDKKV